MARISYVEEKDHPELAADIAKIKGARGGLINIYKLLLHSPTVTMTWFEHIGAIRWKTKLTPRLREIAIVRVAQAAKYAYALNQHVPHIAVPDGVSVDECEALKDWRTSKFFREPERAALAYVDAMIAGPEVPDDVFNAMRKHYNEREVVELTVLVGTYLMHNRVFTALRVDVEPKRN
jgi:4-carboxymuconolactone decarboxylase